MNISDLIPSHFGAASAERLGREAGLSAADAERILHAGLPLQLGALADHARTTEGQAQIGEAVGSLPAFASVEDALSDPEGASQLGQAGALLAPALLGDQAGRIAERTAGGLDVGKVQRLLDLALPLLLSFLGQRGLTAANVGSVLPELKGGSGDFTGKQVIAATAEGPAAGAQVNVGTASADAGTLPVGPLTPGGLIDFLKGQFGGATADRLGRAAGFSGGTAARAVQAALPLVLGALVGRSGTQAGAADLLRRGQEFGRFADSGGRLNTALLGDPAETARIEGQGRGVLGPLFPNVDRVTGRLGSASGGSGANAGRLLALLTPLVLGVIGRRAREDNLDAAALGRLLSGLGNGLAGMLPPGMTGLAPLLAPATTETVVAARPTVTATAAPPRAAPARPAAPPPPATTVVTTTERRRRGFPWWLIPLLLLLLGGCWLLRPGQTATPAGGTAATGAAASGLQVTSPASGAALPAEDFVMRGTGPAGETLRVEEGGQSLASPSVSPDGTWEAAIPAPTPGGHTYTVTGPNGASSQVQVNVGGNGEAGTTGSSPNAVSSKDGTAADTSGATDSSGTGTPPAGTAASGASSAPAGTGAFAITEPAADAQLPAGGFTLRGTGTPGATLQVFEDTTSLGNAVVAGDGTWTLEVPSPAAGPHTYRVQGPGGTELGRVTATVAAAATTAGAPTCDRPYTLSITDGQAVSEPFRFGGAGQGEGYRVTVRRGDRTIGTRDVRLDATCGWSYQSKPGAGAVTYEVRPLGEAGAEPLSTVTLTVRE